MAAGTITWFDDGENYGYITPDADACRIYLDGRELDGSRSAAAVGDRVEFFLDDGLRGPEATGVRVLALPHLPQDPASTASTASTGRLSPAAGTAAAPGSARPTRG